jgi:tetratricopeptide (TPR) repeat protein
MDKGSDKIAHTRQVDPSQLNPQTPAELTNRGWLYYARKEYGRAEADLRRALESNPDEVETLYPLGLTLKAAGSSKEAVEVFHKVVDLAGTIPNPVRANMVRRIAIGHINEIETGNWNLEEEIWNKTG